MNPTLLYYHADLQTYAKLYVLCFKEHVHLKEIKEFDGNLQVGGVLGIEGYSKNVEVHSINGKETLVYFALMDHSMVDHLLEEFKINDIQVPLKVMQTSTNINYTCKELYDHILEEHKQMKGNK